MLGYPLLRSSSCQYCGCESRPVQMLGTGGPWRSSTFKNGNERTYTRYKNLETNSITFILTSAFQNTTIAWTACVVPMWPKTTCDRVPKSQKKRTNNTSSDQSTMVMACPVMHNPKLYNLWQLYCCAMGSVSTMPSIQWSTVQCQCDLCLYGTLPFVPMLTFLAPVSIGVVKDDLHIW